MSFLNFKKMPKEKRNELFLVVLITAAILGGLGYGLIRTQYNAIAKLAGDKAVNNKKLDDIRNTIRRAPQTQKELDEMAKVLSGLEKNMASGDLLSWFITTLRPFKQSYRVEVPQIGTPVRGDMTLLPNFPYKQATCSLVGSGRFHEIGRFVADLENRFPHVRVVNLDLQPAPGGPDRETLAFRMDIVVLLNPNPS